MSAEAEAAVVKQLIADPKLIARLEPHLRPDGFATEEAREAVGAALEYYRATRTAPTSVAIIEEIQKRSVEGGKVTAERVAQLREWVVDACDGAALASDYVVDRIVSRERGEALWRALNAGIKLHQKGEFDEAVAEVRRAGEIGRSSRGAWPTPADRARALGSSGPPMPTGFDTLDRACRGGPRAGGMVAIGGAPGGGKTSWATQLGLNYARAGYATTIVASDETADGLLIRIGQALGFARELLEAGHPETKERLAQALQAIPTLQLLEIDEVDATLEEIAEQLRARAEARPSVLVVDSIQSMAEREDGDDIRARVNAVVATLKRAYRSGSLVIATSELSKAAYRNKDPRERITDLSSFKESGAIEHAVYTGIVLRSVAGENGLFDGVIPKNRWGSTGGAFRLAMNFVTAQFQEEAAPVVNGEAPDERSLLDADMEAVLELLAAAPVDGGTRIIASAMKLKTGMPKGRVEAALDGLKAEKRIVNKGTNQAPRWEPWRRPEQGEIFPARKPEEQEVSQVSRGVPEVSRDTSGAGGVPGVPAPIGAGHRSGHLLGTPGDDESAPAARDTSSPAPDEPRLALVPKPENAPKPNKPRKPRRGGPS
jgi:replicative DNA helicase